MKALRMGLYRHLGTEMSISGLWVWISSSGKPSNQDQRVRLLVSLTFFALCSSFAVSFADSAGIKLKGKERETSLAMTSRIPDLRDSGPRKTPVGAGSLILKRQCGYLIGSLSPLPCRQYFNSFLTRSRLVKFFALNAVVPC